MSYLLDTDILIFYMSGHENVVRCLERSSVDVLYSTPFSTAELWYGHRLRGTGKKQDAALHLLLDKLSILPFCNRSVMLFAEHKAQLHRGGNIIANFDIAIAAIALAHRLTLVTNNVKDFKRIRGLKVENWAK